MSNHITIELCSEDRARLDRLAAAIERMTQPTVKLDPSALSIPPEALEPPVVAQDAQEAPTAEPEHTDAPAPETATETATAPEEDADAKRELIRSKTMALLTANKGAKKERATGIIHAYAPKISAIPEDKLDEALDRLIVLEHEPITEG